MVWSESTSATLALCVCVAATIGAGGARASEDEDPFARRVEELLGRMTLGEKVGQLNMPWVYESALGDSQAAKMENVKRFAAGDLLPGLGPGRGFFTLPNTILHEGTNRGDSVEVTMDLRNSGARQGTEVVQLYLQDVVATVSTPVLQLRGFRRVMLAPGDIETVSFRLGPANLELSRPPAAAGGRAGEFRVMVGASSADIRLSQVFTVRDSKEEK